MQINIAPDKVGKWGWKCIGDGEATDGQGGFETRGEAIAAGRANGGAEEITVTRSGGVSETHFTPPTCRVVLLRLDGSEVGELDAAPGDGAVGQRITLTPAGTDEEAVTNG